MMISVPRRALYWKETRQLVPLLVTILGVSILLLAIWSVLETAALKWAGPYVLLLFPGLFAAGAGAMLVGQEKESRTLWWNVAMAIPPRALIGCKLAVAFIGWAMMWAISLLLLQSLPYDASTIDFARDTVLPWIAYSLFLLSAGFYTAWRVQNAFSSLLMLLPIAVVPFAVNECVSVLRSVVTGRNYFTPTEVLPVLVGVHLASFVITLWLAMRAANRVLAPAESTSKGKTIIAASADSLASLPDEAMEVPFRMPMSSLVWQSIHQSRLTMLGLASLVTLGFLCLARISRVMASTDGGQSMAWWVAGCAAGFSGACWLGVAAFAGDGSSKRMRFLADRGVSPTLAWASRHSIAISLFSMLLVTYGVWTYLDVSIDARLGVAPPKLSMTSLALCLLIAYGVSQWASQTLRIVAANFVIAPVLGFLALIWLTFAISELSMPLGWIAAAVLVPYVATWLGMRWHMEDQSILRMLALGCVTLTLFVLLPITPAIYKFVTWPRVAASRIEELLTASKRLSLAGPGGFVGKENAHDFEADPPSNPTEVAAYLSKLNFTNQDLLAMGLNEADSDEPLLFDSRLSLPLQRASYALLNFEHDEANAESRELLLEWLRSLTVIVKRLRTSHSWQSQDAADVFEIWLVETLSRQQVAPLRDEAVLTSTLAMLSDSAARTEARRRAVLATWRDYRDRRAAQKLPTASLYGNLELLSNVPAALREYLLEDASDQLAVLALDMLDAGAAGQSTEPYRRDMHDLVLGSHVSFAAGPYSDRLRANDVNQPVLIDQSLKYPANQWFAGWESIPQQWAKTASSVP